jgi:hypothetical protein
MVTCVSMMVRVSPMRAYFTNLAPQRIELVLEILEFFVVHVTPPDDLRRSSRGRSVRWCAAQYKSLSPFSKGDRSCATAFAI